MSDEYKELEEIILGTQNGFHDNGDAIHTFTDNTVAFAIRQTAKAKILAYIQANYIKKPKTKSQLQQEPDDY